MNDKPSSTRRQFGKYRIIAHLATGGMAEIFLASQTSLGGFEKLVVIKRILPHLAQEERFVQMFLDEARIAAVLNHPNVVQIFDLGRIDNQYFIAMEYLAGEALSYVVKALRKQKEFLAPELAAGILLQAAEGLQHAHTMTGMDGKPLGIVHRDISPQNIFVLFDGGVKVVDFGIARAAFRTTHTQTGTLKGKYSYMSPEQILGDEIDARSDIFALGIVLWECLTGRKLFRHDSDLKLMQSITEQDAPSPRSINPDVPTVLEQICEKALERDRQDRFQSGAELRSALAAYLKTSQRESDTAAIGSFMQAMFADRMTQKKLLIEGAQVADKEMGEYLFGDLDQYQSDTDNSIPRTTPHTGIQRIRDQAKLQPRRTMPLLALALFLLACTGFGAWYLLVHSTDNSGENPATITPGKSLPVETIDGGARLAVPEAPDAGPVEVAVPMPDAGPTPGPDELRVAAGQPADPADKGEKIPKPGGKKPPDRKPGGGTKVTVASHPLKDHDPKAPPPLPGKLRLATSPWTEIYFEGKKLGQTPLIDVELPSGRIKLRAVNKEMNIDTVITVEIKPGERTSQRFNF